MEADFILKDARAAWLASLEVREFFSSNDLTELESHLDDSIEDLQERGLAPSEAFLVATRRLGPPAALAGEYQKRTSHPAWSLRGKWMVLGIISYLATLAITRMGNDLVTLLTLNLPSGLPRNLTSIAGFLLCSVFGLWLFNRCLQGRLPLRPSPMDRRALGITCAILAAASLLPILSNATAILLGSRLASLNDFSEHLMIRRYILNATLILWFALLVLTLRRHWQNKTSPAT